MLVNSEHCCPDLEAQSAPDLYRSIEQWFQQASSGTIPLWLSRSLDRFCKSPLCDAARRQLTCEVRASDFAGSPPPDGPVRCDRTTPPHAPPDQNTAVSAE